MENNYQIPQTETFRHGIEIDKPEYHPHRPTPDLATGDLKVDPDIVLKAKAFNLAISFFYSGQAGDNLEYGRRRSASVHGHVLSESSGYIRIVHGDFRRFQFLKVGTSGGVTTYASDWDGARTTVTYDGTEFTEHYPSGMKVYYANQTGAGTRHEMVRVETPSGVSQTYTYGTSGEAGLLKTITVPGGDKVTFTYVASSPTSLLSSIEDWGGRRWTFQYDAGRELTTITYPTGCVTKYGYSFAGAGSPNTMLHTIEDPRGYRTTYMYNSQKQVVSMAAGSGVWTYVYTNDFGGLNTAVVTPSGARTTHHFDISTAAVVTIDKPEGYKVTYTYVANGFKATEVLPLSISHAWTNGALGLLESYRDPVGNRTTYMYDSSLNLTTVLNALGETVTMAYTGRLMTGRTDVRGNRETWTYDGDGRVAGATEWIAPVLPGHAQDLTQMPVQ